LPEKSRTTTQPLDEVVERLALVGGSLIVERSSASVRYWSKKPVRAAERILLAARACGLGAAVGHFTGPGSTWAAAADAKRLLNIPERLMLREMISIGYATDHLAPTTNPAGRKPLEQLVHSEHY
jgi:nitroreductase